MSNKMIQYNRMRNDTMTDDQWWRDCEKCSLDADRGINAAWLVPPLPFGNFAFTLQTQTITQQKFRHTNPNNTNSSPNTNYKYNFKMIWYVPWPVPLLPFGAFAFTLQAQTITQLQLNIHKNTEEMHLNNKFDNCWRWFIALCALCKCSVCLPFCKGKMLHEVWLQLLHCYSLHN